MRKSIELLFVLFASLVFQGCGESVEVDFHFNGTSYNSIDPLDIRPNTEDNAFVILTGETLIITDISSPLEKIKSRIWEFEGHKHWDEKYQNKQHFPLVFETTGTYKVTLCINKEKNCVSKRINVFPKFEEDIFAPKVEFTHPSETYSQVKTALFNLKIQTDNIFASDKMFVLRENQELPFEFNEDTGTINIKEVILEQGANPFTVNIKVDNEMIEDYVVIECYPCNKAGTTATAVSIPDDLSIIVPPNRMIARIPAIDFAFRGPKDLTSNNFSITINSRPIGISQFKNINGLWRGKLNLTPGLNMIAVQIIKNGKLISDKREINYKHMVAPPPEVVAHKPKDADKLPEYKSKYKEAKRHARNGNNRKAINHLKDAAEIAIAADQSQRLKEELTNDGSKVFKRIKNFKKGKTWKSILEMLN